MVNAMPECSPAYSYAGVTATYKHFRWPFRKKRHPGPHASAYPHRGYKVDVDKVHGVLFGKGIASEPAFRSTGHQAAGGCPIGGPAPSFSDG